MKPSTLANCLRCEAASVSTLAAAILAHPVTRYMSVHVLTHDMYMTMRGEHKDHASITACRIAALREVLRLCDEAQRMIDASLHHS